MPERFKSEGPRMLLQNPSARGRQMDDRRVVGG